MRQTVEAAWHIARYTAEDPAAGLPDAGALAIGDVRRDLSLHHPWAIGVQQATEIAIETELLGVLAS